MLKVTSRHTFMSPAIDLTNANENCQPGRMNGTPRVIMAMMGCRDHYQPMTAAYESGSLARFITDFWFTPESPILKCAEAFRFRSREVIRGRFAAGLQRAHVTSISSAGALQYLGLRMQSGRAWRHKVYSSAGRRFARACIRYLDVSHSAFIGFSSASLEAIERENRSGVLTALNQVDAARTGERIVIEEMQRHKSWLLHSVEGVPEEYFERLSAEWSAAKRIIVNSPWSRQALIQQGVPPEKIRECPLAYKPLTKPPIRCFRRQQRLRVLWLGTVCLGKGIVYAVEAARLLEQKRVDFTFAGPLDVRLPGLPANSRYIGKIARLQTGKLYASHDIFILPTLSDGFGMTQLEAMAHGLPVIATPHCGEVVEHKISGLIIPARDGRSLADAIMEIGGDTGKLESMSVAATARAEHFSPERIWRTYQSHLI
jgi:glycosyltransferase involved in cell wall biosynthesis